MNKHLLLSVFLFFCLASFAQTSMEGKVKEKETGEPVLFAPVALYKNGVLTNNAETDVDGNFLISDIQPGKYDVEVQYVGLKKVRLTGVVCNAGQVRRIEIEMEPEGTLLDVVEIIEYKVPLIEVDNTTTGTIITSDKIANLPQKQINAIVANSAGVTTNDDGSISVRGSRSNETVTFIDGIRTTGTIPQSEVEQLQLVTGGIEAKYGDVSGGIISLTSKGPSQNFTGGIEAETSEFLDGFGYNLLSANFSGPLLKKKNGQSILGFRFSGQYTNIADNNPSILGVYRAPLSLIEQLEKEPFYTLGTSEVPSAERLRTEDIGSPFKARPNDDQRNINITGKIDARISNNIDLSISGNYEDDKDRFTPGSSGISNSNNSWALLNWHNNPYSYDKFKRINLRFRHKLGKQNDGSASTDTSRASAPSALRNFSYTILLGYERRNGLSEDFRHEDRLFNYGYFGSTAVNYSDDIVDFVNPFNGERTVFHQGFNIETGEFVPNTTINPVLALYKNEFNGVMRPDKSAVWSNLFANVGQVYNSFSKSEDDLFTFNFSSGLDIVPGSSNKGRHSLQFGVLYEQRVLRNYNLAPFGLWNNINDIVNGALTPVIDSNSVKGYFIENGDTLATLFNPVYEDDPERKFYFKIREKLNVGIKDFVNGQALLPDQLSLDMFSPRELTDPGLVSYMGYDYLGNKLTENVSFEDFFRARDSEGRRAFPVAPFSPIYAAGYIQNKFSYKDNIILRVGVRADYYDANTKVFKDPYAIYEIESAEQFHLRNNTEKPQAVGDDYKVYVDGSESNRIIGYRQGDQWYLPNGTAVSGGNVIFNGGVVYPSYVGGLNSKDNRRVLDIQDPNFNPEHSFDDYKPQLNFMPRLAFSFPISQDANFFAHYDVLYQRPPSNSVLTALDYFYFENAGQSGVQNNPNLRPIRTVSYEAGFQQKISNYSAIKMSAYYKENKDLIQRRVYTNIPAPISQYETYGNLDYGTVKGFSFQFDRRRVNNLELTATYTLQFADGSGSDANSSGGINSRGIIRTLTPLSYDERHRFTANLDYRYESGKKYDGPKIGGVDIFADAGINLNAIIISGQPFTRNSIPAQLGGQGFLGAINGSRLPWNFTLDARIDKNLTLAKIGQRSIEGNIYLRVQNVLNTRNVKNVFGYTGDPDNDGYLTSEFGRDRQQDIINTGKDVDSFLDAYSWRMLAGGNYFLPRRMYLGIIFNF